ncbi:MAG: hypothetical protein ACOX4M_02245 [Acetivibrionales bacterium]
MTYNEAYQKGIQLLKDANISSPAADAGVLLCHAARCDRIYLFAHGDMDVGEGILKTYFSMLQRRPGRMSAAIPDRGAGIHVADV